MLGAALRFPRVLWTVNETAVVTNKRDTSTILGEQPAKIEPYYWGALFYLDWPLRVNLDLTAVRIYGAIDDVANFTSTPLSTAPDFPGAGLSQEALCEWGVNTGSVPVLGEGRLRVPTALSKNDSRVAQNFFYPLTVLPNKLLLEYSTANAGAGAHVAFTVSAVFVGFEPTGKA